MSNQLVDRFGRPHSYLRISLTDRCNFRCTYCMPHQGMTFLPRSEILTYEEILRLARLFVEMGVTKIRLTGGEPMVRQDLPVLIEQLAGLEKLETLAMTTNGFYLAEHAHALKAAGLQALNISLDTLRSERFQKIAGTNGLPHVLAGLEAALHTGFDSLKLNVVVMAGVNDDEILDFIAFTRDQRINLRFIEYMPFENNQWSLGGMVSYAEMRRRIETHYQLEPIPTEASAVAKDFQLVGYPGTVSFITSMTENFCGTCNRLRLTADGQIKACLFQDAEINLRDPMRAGALDADLRQLILRAVQGKQRGHESMDVLASVRNRPMIAIGG